MGDNRYLTTEELADMFRTSPETVRYWRHVGTGPKSFKVGRRVLYDREDVTAFIDAARAAPVAAQNPEDRLSPRSRNTLIRLFGETATIRELAFICEGCVLDQPGAAQRTLGELSAALAEFDLRFAPVNDCTRCRQFRRGSAGL